MEIKKQITLVTRRLKEIQGGLRTPESCLSQTLVMIMTDLAKVMETDLYSYRTVTMEHMLSSLSKTSAGILCIQVFHALARIDNQTPMENIMRGLMAPKLKWEVEERATEAATRESKEFIKNIEFLFVLTKKTRISKTLLRKQNGFEIIKDNLEEFEDAKERVDQLQQKLDKKKKKKNEQQQKLDELQQKLDKKTKTKSVNKL